MFRNGWWSGGLEMGTRTGALAGVILCAAVFGALGVHAASTGLIPAPVAPRSPPASHTEPNAAPDDGVHITQEQVEAWLKAHVDTSGWLLIGYTDDSATLAWIGIPAGPLFGLDLRMEYFRPQASAEKGSFNSAATKPAFDCVNRRKMYGGMMLYAGNGLKDSLGTAPFGNQSWTPFVRGNFVDDYVMELCDRMSAGAKPGPSQGATGDGQTAPTTGHMTTDQLEAWLKANVDMKGWGPIAFDDDTVYLAPVDARAASTFQMPIRIESYRPVPTKLTIGSYLSAIVDATYDCVGRRQKADKITVYSEHDMKGRSQTEPLPKAPWMKLDPQSAADAQILALCDEALSGASTDRSSGEGPAGPTQADVDAWVAKTVDPGGDVYAYYDDDGVYYIRGAFTRSASGTALFTSRQENFTPDDMGQRSQTVKVELDCPGKRVRVTEGLGYARHNLEGPATPFNTSGDWVSPQLAEQSAQLERLCDMTAGAK